MARLMSFMICDAINNIPVSNPDSSIKSIPALMAPTIVLRPKYIPGNFSFGIALGISDVNLQEQNRMKIIIKNSNNDIVYDSGEKEIPIADKPDTLKKEYQGFIMCADIRNLSIDIEGEYSFEIYINGDLIETKMVPIYSRG